MHTHRSQSMTWAGSDVIGTRDEWSEGNGLLHMCFRSHVLSRLQCLYCVLALLFPLPSGQQHSPSPCLFIFLTHSFFHSILIYLFEMQHCRISNNCPGIQICIFFISNPILMENFFSFFHYLLWIFCWIQAFLKLTSQLTYYILKLVRCNNQSLRVFSLDMWALISLSDLSKPSNSNSHYCSENVSKLRWTQDGSVSWGWTQFGFINNLQAETVVP